MSKDMYSSILGFLLCKKFNRNVKKDGLCLLKKNENLLAKCFRKNSCE